jgi:hypothetical protein
MLFISNYCRIHSHETVCVHDTIRMWQPVKSWLIVSSHVEYVTLKKNVSEHCGWAGAPPWFLFRLWIQISVCRYAIRTEVFSWFSTFFCLKVRVNLSLCLIRHDVMLIYGGVEVYASPFLTLALDGGEWSASRPCFYNPTPREIPKPFG